MKSFLPILGLALSALASPTRESALESRATSKSWQGTNLYFLQGLSDDRQDEYISQLKDFGIKVLRVWVNGQNGDNHCEKGSHIVVSVPDLETTLGQYNDQTLDALDKVINKLAKAGIKALISPHDANRLDPKNSDAYNARWGSGFFYEKQDAFDMYDARLSHILNYKGKYSGKVWKNWHDGIMGFDLQNEPMTTKPSECLNGDTHGWICGRAKHLRKVLGDKNPIKVATGGIGGDFSHQCNLISAATQCDALDLISIHRYVGTDANHANKWEVNENTWVSQANKKLVYLEEWGFNTTVLDYKTEFPENVQDMAAAGLPNMHWQILPSKVCDYRDGDPFGIHIGSGLDFKKWCELENKATAKQDWSFLVG